MWVLGLAWMAITAIAVGSSSEINSVLQSAVISLVLLVPNFLIIFSLRDRHKPN
jgi:hypothetical protein